MSITKFQKISISLVFTLAISLSLASLSVEQSYPISHTLESTTRIYDDNDISNVVEEKYSDKTFIQRISNTKVVNSDSGAVDRLITNNGTHFNVHSGYGSFSYDKSDCTTTFYNYGVNPTIDNFNATTNSIFVEEMFWTIYNEGSVVDATQFGCSIVTSSNSTGKYLTATRSHASGSTLDVTISSVIGKPFEDFTTFTNQIAGWDGNNISFAQIWNGMAGDSIVLPDGTNIGDLAVGSYSMDRTQLIKTGVGESILQISQSNNPFLIDLELAKDKVGRVDAEVRVDGRVNLTFVFDNNVQPLALGSSISLDTQYKFITTSVQTDLLDVNLSTVEEGSMISNGNISIPVVGGTADTTCKLYLVNDYINSEAVTDSFTCSGISVLSLNEQGVNIFTAKIFDRTASFQIINSAQDVFQLNESDVLIDVTFKKPQYFAQLDGSSIVQNIIVADDEFIASQSGVWIELLKTGNSKDYGSIGGFYNNTDGFFYTWNENTLSWELI